MKFDWLYLYLTNDGKLVDEDGYECIANAPRFSSVAEAETWLEEEDIRANCVGRK